MREGVSEQVSEGAAVNGEEGRGYKTCEWN